jgi:putative ABC transport system permease protein
VRGRWFDEADANSVVPSIVINQLYADQYLRDREPLNTHIQVDGRERKVVGVIDHYKYQSDYLAEHPMTIMFEPSRSHAENFLSVRVKPGTPAIFEMQLGNMIENGSLSGFQIKIVTNERISANRLFKIPMYILLFLCTFLILNVALGLFGVVWYNINNRTAEIGLRQAVGATKAMINFQLVGEQLAIALVSVVVGFIVAIQFPILNVFNLDGSIYFMGIFLATVTVLLIILVCSFLPGRRASRIHPATALHEE